MKYQIYKDKRGEWRWRLVARNGKIIADSGEGYKTRRALAAGIRAVRRADLAPAVEVDR